jgi:hypothetical protein
LYRVSRRIINKGQLFNDQTVVAVEKHPGALSNSNFVWRFFQKLGPGLITGASDDDPSGIGTYAKQVRSSDTGIGWTMLFTYPLTTGIQ